MFERVAHWCRFEYIEIRDQTVNNKGCRIMHQFQIHLTIPADKLKHI